MPTKMTTDVFITRAKEIHRDDAGSPLYEYTKSVYVKSAQKLIITCKIHGDFEQSPNSHLSNHGCKKCANTLIGKKQTTSHADFIKKCEEKHPNKLDYSKTIYINQKTLIREFTRSISPKRYINQNGKRDIKLHVQKTNQCSVSVMVTSCKN